MKRTRNNQPPSARTDRRRKQSPASWTSAPPGRTHDRVDQLIVELWLDAQVAGIPGRSTAGA